jgi:hypothetical protein
MKFPDQSSVKDPKFKEGDRVTIISTGERVVVTQHYFYLYSSKFIYINGIMDCDGVWRYWVVDKNDIGTWLSEWDLRKENGFVKALKKFKKRN